MGEGGEPVSDSGPGRDTREKSVAEGAASAGRRVLVVEDHPELARTFALMLELAGHDVRTAPDAHAALNIAVEFQPEVFFVDIGLPEIDGYELARRLRAQAEYRGSLLVAVSGYGRPEDRARSAAAGFDRHLAKPVPFDALREVLESWKPPDRP